jgi:hypothetical protein
MNMITNFRARKILGNSVHRWKKSRSFQSSATKQNLIINIIKFSLVSKDAAETLRAGLLVDC